MWPCISFSSLEEIWVAVLNITGPLSSWSFADNKLPGDNLYHLQYFIFDRLLWLQCIIFAIQNCSEPETHDGGPPSYICRLSGTSHENWTFWLEVKYSVNFTSWVLSFQVLLKGSYLFSILCPFQFKFHYIFGTSRIVIRIRNLSCWLGEWLLLISLSVYIKRTICRMNLPYSFSSSQRFTFISGLHVDPHPDNQGCWFWRGYRYIITLKKVFWSEQF